jgi:hypothetical protein
MTDEERQLIQTLADHVKNAPAPQVDRDADNLIRQTIGARPDALYILTQTVLVQEMAINQAKQQIEQLKQQAAQPPANFLPSNPAPQQSSGYRSGGYQGSSYQRSEYAPPPPPPPQVQYIQDPQPSGGRFSSFLQNAAQTAAGVVAGEVAFSALSSIFGGHGGGGGFFGGGGYGISPGSETIINNYYDDDRGRGGGGSFGNDRSLSDSGLSPDLEDRRFAGSDSGDDQQADDDQQDDLQQDDSDVSDDNTDDSSDDGSSYDDGSGSNDV